MTWLLTLAGLPRAGGNSKPHHYKQIVQKMKNISETWVLTENNLKISNENKNKNVILAFQKPQWDTRTLKHSTEYRPCKQ